MVGSGGDHPLLPKRFDDTGLAFILEAGAWETENTPRKNVFIKAFFHEETISRIAWRS